MKTVPKVETPSVRTSKLANETVDRLATMHKLATGMTRSQRHMSGLTREEIMLGHHMIDLAESLTLSAFPNHGKGEKLRDEHFDEMLELINMKDLKPQLVAAVNGSSVTKFVDLVFGCVKKNPSIVAFAGRYYQQNVMKEKKNELWKKYLVKASAFWYAAGLA